MHNDTTAAVLAKPMDTGTTPPDSNPVAAMNAARQRIPCDVVNQATASLPDNQRDAIRRFHLYYTEHDLSLEAAADLLGFNTGAILSQVFRGKYESKLDNVVTKIESFLDFEERRQHGKRIQFIETALSKSIWEVCSATTELNKISFLFSDSQIGKSEALKEYKARNEANTVYVEVPTGGTLINFLQKLAETLRISPHSQRADLRRRIINSFDARMLLIVDEAHKAIDPKRPSALQTIEFCREIFNEKQCGLVFCATNVFRMAMESGPLEPVLRQTKRRRLFYRKLDERPTQADLDKFTKAYGLAPSAGADRVLEAGIVKDEALGMWLTILRMAARVCSQRKQTMTWRHVHAAYDVVCTMEGRTNAYN